MNEKIYKKCGFHFFIVTEGDKWGLLIRKDAGNDSFWSYFWLNSPEGIGPSKRISEKCNGKCFPIECYEYYQKNTRNYGRFRNQEKIFRELFEYAKAAVQATDNKIENPLTQDYSYAKKGYTVAMNRFIRSGTPLSQFFSNPKQVNSEIFTTCVIDKIKDKEILTGNATFSFWNSNTIFPDDNFDYFMTIDQVLDFKIKKPEWFRLGGPILSDFEDGRVYLREIVKDINTEINNNSFVLLEGNAATGKSVIVRNLLYNYYKENNLSIFYFDVSEKRHFDESKLLNEIRSTDGVFIVENVHLEPQKISYIYKRLKQGNENRVLFTARPTLNDFENEHTSVIKDIKTKKMNHPDDALEIIRHFSQHPAGNKVALDVHKDILSISKAGNSSKHDLWLLALAVNDYRLKPIALNI